MSDAQHSLEKIMAFIEKQYLSENNIDTVAGYSDGDGINNKNIPTQFSGSSNAEIGKFFETTPSGLIMPDGVARQLSDVIKNELISSLGFKQENLIPTVKSAKNILTSIQIQKGDTDGWIRQLSPTLANVYDDFESVRRNKADILDFSRIIGDILNNIIKPAPSTTFRLD